ncbi:hypothetical protein [Bosea sp. ASV33]|uniref:hypothetical protein n=1 Tax=Bosea sp. ASV33 TaxID=2795106 RepID=UPI0018EA92E4|nr:hypothetical protein [Bosea sp. ASV33]
MGERGHAGQDRPILFSAPMVRALLDGRKTQTRRILKPQPLGHVIHYGWQAEGGAFWTDQNFESRRIPFWTGDRLWVREALECANGEAIGYPADGTWFPNDCWRWARKSLPSIHMPRAYSRLTLTVTNVRVQRLQEISADDAVAEGVTTTEFWRPKDVEGKPFEDKWWDDLTFWQNYPQIAFRALWESINGTESWRANPWVAAYTFAVERRNIDAPTPTGEASDV